MKPLVSAIAILIICLVHLANAEETRMPSAQEVERPLSPMMLEIKDLQDMTHQAVAALNRSLGEARGDEQIMDIQREISRLKMEARIETMRIQLKYAVAEGNEEAAAKLEEVITHLTTAPRSANQVRPAPARARN